jgi:hypothetical protein
VHGAGQRHDRAGKREEHARQVRRERDAEGRQPAAHDHGDGAVRGDMGQQQRVEHHQHGKRRHGKPALQVQRLAQHEQQRAGCEAPGGRQHDQPVGGGDGRHDEGCGEIGGRSGHWRGGSCQ